jgi:hypothetical protein
LHKCSAYQSFLSPRKLKDNSIIKKTIFFRSNGKPRPLTWAFHVLSPLPPKIEIIWKADGM